MFSGDSLQVFIRIHKPNLGDFIDWFGMDFRVIEENAETITVRIKVNENAVYYWALQYGSVAEVIKPEILRARIKNGLAELLDKYTEK